MHVAEIQHHIGREGRETSQKSQEVVALRTIRTVYTIQAHLAILEGGNTSFISVLVPLWGVLLCLFILLLPVYLALSLYASQYSPCIWTLLPKTTLRTMSTVRNLMILTYYCSPLSCFDYFNVIVILFILSDVFPSG